MQSHLTTLIHRLTAAPFKATSHGVRNAMLALALLVASAQLSSAAVTVTATNDDGVTPNSTKKNPGDNVTYTIQINSTGTTDATGVTLTDPRRPTLPRWRAVSTSRPWRWTTLIRRRFKRT